MTWGRFDLNIFIYEAGQESDTMFTVDNLRFREQREEPSKVLYSENVGFVPTATHRVGNIRTDENFSEMWPVTETEPLLISITVQLLLFVAYP